MTDNTNGQQPRDAATVTSDLVKKHGLEVAGEIRELAKRAREEGEAMAAFAEQVASDIIESSSHAAERISGYLNRCAAARTSVEEHKNTLANLPEHNAQCYEVIQDKVKGIATYAPTNPQYAAVEHALGKLLLQDK